MLAAAFWLITAFGKFYTQTYNFPLDYINKPADLVITNKLPKEAILTIRSSGWYLAGLYIKSNTPTILIDLAKYNDDNYVLETKDILYSFTKQLSKNYQVIDVIPQTIMFDFDEKSFKTVPIHANYSLDMKKQFDTTSSPTLIPDSIQISGPQAKLKKITFWPTDSIIIKEGDVTIKQKIALVESSILGVELIDDSTEITIPIEEHTEGSKEVVINTINTPAGKSVIIYPKEVTVQYWVALSDYEKVEEDAFECFVDFQDIDLSINKVPVKIETHSQKVNKVRVIPPEVEYVVYE